MAWASAIASSRSAGRSARSFSPRSQSSSTQSSARPSREGWEAATTGAPWNRALRTHCPGFGESAGASWQAQRNTRASPIRASRPGSAAGMTAMPWAARVDSTASDSEVTTILGRRPPGQRSSAGWISAKAERLPAAISTQPGSGPMPAGGASCIRALNRIRSSAARAAQPEAAIIGWPGRCGAADASGPSSLQASIGKPSSAMKAASASATPAWGDTSTETPRAALMARRSRSSSARSPSVTSTLRRAPFHCPGGTSRPSAVGRPAQRR